MTVEALLLAYCETHRDTLIERVVDCVMATQSPVPSSREESLQAARGLVTMLCEELSKQSTQTREFWLETLFPSLLERGRRLPDLTAVGVAINVGLAVHLVCALPEASRPEATAWLMRWLADLQAEITTVCLAAAKH